MANDAQLSRSLGLGMYKPYNPIPPDEKPQDYSYWGMNKPAVGANRPAPTLREMATERIDALKSKLSQPPGDLNAIYNQDTEVSPEQYQQAMMESTNKVLDWMNPIPISGLGTIVGKGASKVFDPRKVGEAKKMLEEGLSMQDVTFRTGYYKDRVGNWKTQIPDNRAQVAYHIAEKGRKMTPLDIRKAKNQPQQLRNVLDHKDLYENYPWLATKGEFKFTDEVGYAAMSPKFLKDGTLSKVVVMVNPDGVRKYANAMELSYPEAMRSMMLHEAQHAVQTIEKFPNGNSPGWIEQIRKESTGLKRKIERLKHTKRQLPADSQRAKEINAEITEAEGQIKLFDSASNLDSNALYRHSIGEGDAFWTQSMRDDPGVASKLPSHERTEGPRIMMEGNTLPLQEKFMNVTYPGHTPYMFDPQTAVSAGSINPASRAGVPPTMSEINLGHTSPYQFDKFDLSKVGTGEGAQGFGHGVYLWSDPEVGRYYKGMFEDRAKAQAGNIEDQIRSMEQKLRQPRGVSNEEAKRMRGEIATLKEGINRDAVRVYDVEVPDELANRIGNYDESLANQPAQVQEAMDRLLNDIYDRGYGATAKELIKDLEKRNGELPLSQILKKVQTYGRLNDRALSQTLREYGIVGHRFYDGLSRATTKNSHNYVIYDDTIPQIKGQRNI